MVLLKQIAGKIKVAKADDIDIPDGVITNGNITDATALGDVIKKLLNRNRIRYRQAVVSLVAKPVLIQIIDLPEEIPGNLRQFVQTEIKHSSVLAGKEPHYDFCGFVDAELKSMSRILVGATDHEKVSTLLKALSIARVEPMVIELDMIASIRALYSEKIANEYDCNVLVALLCRSAITICVFRKGALDFIRAIDISDEQGDFDKYVARYQDEINAVIQFYEIEVDIATANDWKIFAVSNDSSIDTEDLR